MIIDSQVNYLLKFFIFYLHLRLAVDFIEEVHVSRDGRFANKNHRDNVTDKMHPIYNVFFTNNSFYERICKDAFCLSFLQLLFVYFLIL